MINKQAWIRKSRLGGLKRIEPYGNSGTAEGRIRGGKRTIELFHKNPDWAKKTGFILRKQIKYPKKCAELAELIGVILGDSGLPGNHQVVISFNGKTGRGYMLFLGKVLRKLFSVGYHIHLRKNCNGADIVVSSSNLVDFLVKQGLTIGNKVRNQVDIPSWIYNKHEYQFTRQSGVYQFCIWH